MGLNVDAMRPMYEKAANERLILGLTIGGIARTEKIEVSDDVINQHLETIAAGFGDPAMVRSWYQEKEERMDSLKGDALEKLVINWIVDKAQVSEEKVSFAKLIAQTAESAE